MADPELPPGKLVDFIQLPLFTSFFIQKDIMI
jgi:hypothetical protein